ncbi:MAG: hypothetical protein J6K53_05290 [Roseburia sp.]|nr:hypothetical protein [Roseburia sp.]
MKRIREFFSDLSETITVTKLDGVLIVAVSVLAGMFLGMLCSPRKTTRWYNGNQIYRNGAEGELPESDGTDEETISFR